MKETVEHAFDDCPFAQKFWTWFQTKIWDKAFPSTPCPANHNSFTRITGLPSPPLNLSKSETLIWSITHAFAVSDMFARRCIDFVFTDTLERPSVDEALIALQRRFISNIESASAAYRRLHKPEIFNKLWVCKTHGRFYYLESPTGKIIFSMRKLLELEPPPAIIQPVPGPPNPG